MVTESEIWECVKKNNSFLVKRSQGSNKAQFSAEPGNLYNLNTFKYSGLANSKTIDIATDKSDAKNTTVVQAHARLQGQVLLGGGGGGRWRHTRKGRDRSRSR